MCLLFHHVGDDIQPNIPDRGSDNGGSGQFSVLGNLGRKRRREECTIAADQRTVRASRLLPL